MKFPYKMKPFEEDIKQFSDHLVALRKEGKLAEFPRDRLYDLVLKISETISEDDEQSSQDFAVVVTEGFMIAWNGLYSSIGDKICVDNPALIATMLEASFIGSIQAIAKFRKKLKHSQRRRKPCYKR